MTRKSLIERNAKRAALAARSRTKRSLLVSKRNDKSITLEERFAIQKKINSLRRDCSPARYRNRCSITGRPRAYYRMFGISRIQLRLMAGWAKLPGVVKASW